MYDLEESLPAAPQPSTLYLNVPIRNSPSTDKNISERTTASVGCPNATNFESLANEIPVDLNRPSEIENKRPSSSYRNYECGEPMRPQHLRIDFSPSEQDDNEETEMKCIDFFKYLQGRPDIQRLMVTPVLVGWEVPTQPSTVESMKEEVEDKEQAVYWMEVLSKPLKSKKLNSYSSSACDGKLDQPESLCVEMDEFDKKHPKSFENPGPAFSVAQYDATANVK